MSSSVCGGPTQRFYRNHVALQTDFIEVEHNWDLVVARHKGREHAPPRMLCDAVQAYRQDRKSNETPCGIAIASCRSVPSPWAQAVASTVARPAFKLRVVT